MASDKRTPVGVVKALIGFVAMSVVAGVLAAVTVTPTVALTGLAANQTIGIFEGLPEYLEIGKLSEKSNIYATNSDGSQRLLASFYVQNRVEVPWDGVAQSVKDAAVAGEDPRYYQHGGVDIQGTLRAVVNNAAGNDVQGGSSITQQYVKNVLIEKAVRESKTEEERNAAIEAATAVKDGGEARKVREMKLAIGVEKKYTKDQILLGYLNIAFFGGTVYGIEAAANYYFGTSAAALSIPQAASLIATVNNPYELKIDDPENADNGAANGYAENKVRRDYIIGKMLDEKKITQADHDAAVATPVEPVITQPSTGCQTAGGAGFFCDYVTQIFKNNTIFGADEDTRWNNFRQGGFDVYTTLDPDLQAASEEAVNANVPYRMSGFDVGGVAVAVQPGTGRVLAMAQNKNYSQDPIVQEADPAGTTAINYNTDVDYGGSVGFQPGSTYKLFTLLEWLKEGHSLNESVNATVKANWGTFKNTCNADGEWYDPTWSPKNDEGGNGGIWTAQFNTMNSENTGFVAMAKQLDLCEIKKTAESMGVHRANGDPLGDNGSAILGTEEVAPLSMAGAFAAVAAGGTVCDPIAIDRIVAADGTDQPVPGANCREGVPENVAATAAIALQAVVTGGTATSSNPRTGVPHIGKTGTTDGSIATWMSGASTKVALTVGVFNVTGFVNQRGTSFPSGSAATARHRMWPAIMRVADGKYGGDEFPEADQSLINAAQIPVPDVRGKAPADAKSILDAAGFTAVDGGQRDSALPAGQVDGTDPSGTASKGSAISFFTSNGKLKVVPDVNGKNLNDAKAAFSGAGIASITVQCTTDAKAPAGGKITGQNPAAGTSITPETKVTISIQQTKC